MAQAGPGLTGSTCWNPHRGQWWGPQEASERGFGPHCVVPRALCLAPKGPSRVLPLQLLQAQASSDAPPPPPAINPTQPPACSLSTTVQVSVGGEAPSGLSDPTPPLSHFPSPAIGINSQLKSAWSRRGPANLSMSVCHQPGAGEDEG